MGRRGSPQKINENVSVCSQTFLNSSFSFYMPNCRRKMMFIPNAYKIIIQISAGYFSEIHFPRLSYLIEVFQMNDHANHLVLCALLLPSPKLHSDTSAPLLPDMLLHILQHSLQKSLSPGSLLQFPLLPAHLSSLHYKLMWYICLPHYILTTLGGLGAYLLHFSISTAYHSDWTSVQGVSNEYMLEWVSAWGLCLPLGYESFWKMHC